MSNTSGGREEEGTITTTTNTSSSSSSSNSTVPVGSIKGAVSRLMSDYKVSWFFIFFFKILINNNFSFSLIKIK